MAAETPRLRAEALYRDDAGLPIRRSHVNEEVKALYRDFLGEPNSRKAHELLHTHYYRQSRICKSK
jgi:iron only hydrogenase large subunit-like protein